MAMTINTNVVSINAQRNLSLSGGSLSRSQILQQAGTAMVAQANQMSQGVLSLLQ